MVYVMAIIAILIILVIILVILYNKLNKKIKFNSKLINSVISRHIYSNKLGTHDNTFIYCKRIGDHIKVDPSVLFYKLNTDKSFIELYNPKSEYITYAYWDKYLEMYVDTFVPQYLNERSYYIKFNELDNIRQRIKEQEEQLQNITYEIL